MKKIEEIKGSCCPACTSIEKCKPLNNEEKNYKWSQECCEKCYDTACTQSPFYILSLIRNSKREKKDFNIFRDYHEEALRTILSF